ncbi:MAG: helix-turn-helix transcriptional regulator [Candidatus Krumholzibacteria bacterium]|nr:helix-turn-helix transcriptional regulator [Candidatus Krumholzibacteria bacterium]
MKEGIIMNIYGRSDLEILREIARRLKRRRLNLNIPQQELADRTGLNRATISGIERGKPFGVLTLIQILRALDALEDLGSFVPDPGISPLQLARMKGRERKRAYRKSGEISSAGDRKKEESEW